MVYLNAIFTDSDVFTFLRGSSLSHPRRLLVESQKPTLAHAQARIVRIPFGIVRLADRSAQRVSDIIELALPDGGVLTYMVHQGCCLTPEAPLIPEQMSEIIMHNPMIPGSPLARFSGPILVQPHSNQHKNQQIVAAEIMAILGNLGLNHPNIQPPKIDPSTIHSFSFSEIGPE